MNRSFVRLVVTSVLVCWAGGFAVLFVHSRSLSWLDERARTDGAFLARDLLRALPPDQRAQRLDELRPHYAMDLRLVDVSEVQQHIGRVPQPGEAIPHRASAREEWYFFAFDDEARALAVGPVNPTIANGFIPIGVILAGIGLPLIAAWLAVRVNREVRKVEHATDELARGELGARVDNPTGPSNELAASFNAMAERIERLVRSREELVQAVSHELGSPLSRLRFHLELLENLDEKERAERFAAMTRELDALDELVAELLGYVQSDETVLERQTFDPAQVLRDLAELAQLDTPEDTGIDVQVTLQPDVHINADPRLFQRAVENLLRNALRYGHSQVRLELASSADRVRIDVHDDGPGIDEALREKVVAPFFRQEPDRARTTGGVGLGLAIVSRIVQRHGGELEIDDSSLGGARVSTLWPVR